MRIAISKIYRNIRIQTLCDQIIVSGVNFLIGALLARILGIDIFGNYAFALLILYFFSGIHQAFIIAPLYSLLELQFDKSEFLSHLVSINFIFAITTGIIGSLIFYFTSNYIGLEINTINYLVFFTWIFSFIIFDFLRRYYFATKKSINTLIIDFIAYGLQPFLILSINHYHNLTIGNIMIMQSCTFIITASISVLFIEPVRFQTKNIRPVLKTVYDYSKYLILTSFIQFFSGNIFLGAASIIMGPIALGIIRMAQNLIGILNVLFLAMENLIPIKAAEVLAKKGNLEMLHYFKKIGLKGLLITLLIVGLIILFKDSLIKILYGSDYVSYSWTVVYFGILYLFVFVGTMARFLIRTTAQNHIILIGYVVSSIISLIIAYPLIMHFQLPGVFVGLFISQIVTIATYYTFLKKSLLWSIK